MAKKVTTSKKNNNGLAENEDASALDSAFDEAEKTDAEFTPEQKPEEEQEQQEQTQSTSEKTTSEGSPAPPAVIDPNTEALNKMKIQFVTGFILYLFSGINTFILNMVSGTEVPMEELEFNEAEKKAVSVYVDTPQIMELLNKMPPWLMAIMHMEWIVIRKFRAVKGKYKKKKKEETEKKK